jgi:hypothetical protein
VPQLRHQTITFAVEQQQRLSLLPVDLDLALSIPSHFTLRRIEHRRNELEARPPRALVLECQRLTSSETSLECGVTKDYVSSPRLGRISCKSFRAVQEQERAFKKLAMRYVARGYEPPPGPLFPSGSCSAIGIAPHPKIVNR